MNTIKLDHFSVLIFKRAEWKSLIVRALKNIGLE